MTEVTAEEEEGRQYHNQKHGLWGRMGDAILPDPHETGLSPFPIAFAHLSFPLCLGVLSRTTECHEGYIDDRATSGGTRSAVKVS